MTTYRVTYRDNRNIKKEMPVISESAFQAVEDLKLLGYHVRKLEYTYPTI